MRHPSRAVAVLAFLALPVFLHAANKSGPVQTLAGTGEKGYAGDGGTATDAKLNDPCGLVVGPDQALYFCDTANHAIRRIAPDQTITTVAGTGQPGHAGDGGGATEATLHEPYAGRFDKSGTAFLGESNNHRIAR